MSVSMIENHLWEAADTLRANSGLRAADYSVPVLGLIFLRYADHCFAQLEAELRHDTRRARPLGKLDYQARGVMYVPPEARFSYLVRLPESADVGKTINNAMKLIEEENEALRGSLPRAYMTIEKSTLRDLLKTFDHIPMDAEGDIFGRIYEYFLGEFAMAEGQRGGEFFTPTALVRLIVDIIEPFHGRILDPACGSGGMFVQSARFVTEHQRSPGDEISIYGQEKTRTTVNLCKMNLAVHGLSGDVREANSYYDFNAHYTGLFDFVMANPPFNVDGVDKERIKNDKRRFPFGMPTVANAKYLWIQLFFSALKPGGRAGFVMANSASDARGSELAIRQQLIEARAVDVMVAIGGNFFYTVTLPCTLWFLDAGKADTPRAGTVLFIDARHVFHQVDRAHRDFTPAQSEFLANVVRLYRGEEPENAHASADLLRRHFPDGRYADVPGLCKVASIAEIQAQGWSLNPGRYVGVAAREAEAFDFRERLEELSEELELLNVQAHALEEIIAANVATLLEDGVADTEHVDESE